MAWFSGNALVSINVVTLRRARLIPGWATVCGRVNHPGNVISHLGQLSLLSLRGRLIEYQRFWLWLGWAHSPVSGGRVVLCDPI